ncbi:MAG: four helix bundle protein [Candidatus Paceibacterota bacterium]|jgi:four helix bundle protein
MNKAIFRFLEWQVYKDAKSFRQKVKSLINKKFPKEERYKLIDQIERAANSVCLNIAEGSNKLSDIELSHYLNIASTSIEEVISGLDLAKDDGYITEKEFEDFCQMAEEVSKQLVAFGKFARNR